MLGYHFIPLTPEALRARREQFSLSRKALADKTGISLRTLESYEQTSNHRPLRYPSRENAALLGRILECYFFIPWDSND